MRDLSRAPLKTKLHKTNRLLISFSNRGRGVAAFCSSEQFRSVDALNSTSIPVNYAKIKFLIGGRMTKANISALIGCVILGGCGLSVPMRYIITMIVVSVSLNTPTTIHAEELIAKTPVSNQASPLSQEKRPELLTECKGKPLRAPCSCEPDGTNCMGPCGAHELCNITK
jgi:hypothetical protein